MFFSKFSAKEMAYHITCLLIVMINTLECFHIAAKGIKNLEYAENICFLTINIKFLINLNLSCIIVYRLNPRKIVRRMIKIKSFYAIPSAHKKSDCKHLPQNYIAAEGIAVLSRFLYYFFFEVLIFRATLADFLPPSAPQEKKPANTQPTYLPSLPYCIAEPSSAFPKAARTVFSPSVDVLEILCKAQEFCQSVSQGKWLQSGQEAALCNKQSSLGTKMHLNIGIYSITISKNESRGFCFTLPAAGEKGQCAMDESIATWLMSSFDKCTAFQQNSSPYSSTRVGKQTAYPQDICCVSQEKQILNLIQNGAQAHTCSPYHLRLLSETCSSPVTESRSQEISPMHHFPRHPTSNTEKPHEFQGSHKAQYFPSSSCLSEEHMEIEQTPWNTPLSCCPADFAFQIHDATLRKSRLAKAIKKCFPESCPIYSRNSKFYSANNADIAKVLNYEYKNMQGAGDINRIKKDLVIPGLQENLSSKSPYTTYVACHVPPTLPLCHRNKEKREESEEKKKKRKITCSLAGIARKNTPSISVITPAKSCQQTNGSRESFRSSIHVQLCFYSIQTVQIGIHPISPLLISNDYKICGNSYNKLKFLACHMKENHPSHQKEHYLQIHAARTCNPVIETQNNYARHERSHEEWWRLHPATAVSKSYHFKKRTNLKNHSNSQKTEKISTEDEAVSKHICIVHLTDGKTTKSTAKMHTPAYQPPPPPSSHCMVQSQYKPEQHLRTDHSQSSHRKLKAQLLGGIYKLQEKKEKKKHSETFSNSCYSNFYTLDECHRVTVHQNYQATLFTKRERHFHHNTFSNSTLILLRNNHLFDSDKHSAHCVPNIRTKISEEVGVTLFQAEEGRPLEARTFPSP
ncbi:hypothetical protein EK904_011670 [Melospiza melodia maxima]|nr:hypothetical protein EK904_011670 [Melospiza melodia maxima]